MFFSVTHLDSLQEDILISDAFINILLQLTQIEAYPTHVLVVPGFRGCTGQASDYDASKQVISRFIYHLHMKFETMQSIQMDFIKFAFCTSDPIKRKESSSLLEFNGCFI